MGGEDDENVEAVGELFNKVEKNVVRSRVIQGLPRIDGRDQKQSVQSAVKLVC